MPLNTPAARAQRRALARRARENVVADAIDRWRAKERRSVDTQRPASIVTVGPGDLVEVAVDGDEDGHTVTVPVLGELPRDDSDNLISDRVMVGFAEGGWAAIVDVIGLEDAT